MMIGAVGTAAPLLVLLRRRGSCTPLGGPLDVARSSLTPQNLQGAGVFGVGWAVAGTCPGAVEAMTAAGPAAGPVRDGRHRAASLPP